MIGGLHREDSLEWGRMEKCSKCGKTGMWLKRASDGKKVLWCEACKDIVGGLRDGNPFLDERSI